MLHSYSHVLVSIMFTSLLIKVQILYKDVIFQSWEDSNTVETYIVATINGR